MQEDREGRSEDVWTENAGEKEMERDTETLPGYRSSATLDWSECVCTLWALAMVASMPVLLEMPAAVMCCDRG